MNSIQLKVQKDLMTMIVWLSFLTILACVCLYPNIVQGKLEKEIQNTAVNEEKINAPEVDTIIEALSPLEDTREFSFRGVTRKRENRDRPQEKLEIDINIPFGLNEYQISDTALPYLQRLGKALSHPGLKNSVFEIQGHTCNLGREDYNLWLSQKRAEAVKYHLIRHYGLSLNQLKTVGYGPQKPKWNNSSEKGRAKNRRVTIINTLKNFEKKYITTILEYSGKIQS